MSIKLLKAAIDIFKLPTTTKTEEIIILRGVVDPESLKEIKVDKYQREVLSSAKIKALMVALASSGVSVFPPRGGGRAGVFFAGGPPRGPRPGDPPPVTFPQQQGRN